MTDPSTSTPGTGARRAPARVTVPGLDRVMWQRLPPDGSKATVAGIRHRRPATVTVSPETARTLLEAGVPTVRAGRDGS